MAETLTPDGLMRIYPMWLQGWVGVCKQALFSWLDDRAPTMGAAIAYYTVFSLAPILVLVIGVAGLAFGWAAAEGALFAELADLVGPESAAAVQAMLRSASGTRSGIVATAFGIGTLIIAATAVPVGSKPNLEGTANERAWHLAYAQVAACQPLGNPRDRVFAVCLARD